MVFHFLLDFNWKYWKLTEANITQNTFWIMNGLYVYTVCSVHKIFPLFFPRGLAQIEFDLGPRTVRVSMASKRFAIYWRERESLWDWTCIQNLKMICNQKHLHSTYLCTVCTYISIMNDVRLGRQKNKQKRVLQVVT